MQSIFLCVSIGTGLLLSEAYSRSEPYDRSTLDLVSSFVISAGVFLFVQWSYPSFLSGSADRNEDRSEQQYDAILLSDVRNGSNASQRKNSTDFGSGKLVVRHKRWLALLAILALAVRIEIHRKITASAQCTSRSPAILITLALAINEGRYHRQARLSGDEDAVDAGSRGRISKAILFISRTRWRYIPCALVVIYGGSTIASTWRAQSSTFICPIVSGETFLVPRMQKLGLLLDCLLAIIVDGIARSASSSRPKMSALLSFVTVVLVGAAILWSAYAVLLYTVRWEEMDWLLVHDTVSLYKFVVLMFGQGLLFSLFLFSSLCCIHQFGIYQLSMALTAASVVCFGLGKLWHGSHQFPPTTSSPSAWPFIFLYCGVWSSYRIGQGPGHVHSLRSTVFQFSSLIVLLILVVPKLRATSTVSFHPIEQLMFEAKSQHSAYIQHAGESKDLHTAIAIYRKRYHTEPPPGFDKWYEYASSRSVLVMDEYDQIYRDLLPFRSISPAVIRRRTWEAVSNPWNEISGITIRNGSADVQENVIPTHRWMLEGVAVLINTFAKDLPDMDLAFNLNDESRVAVPHEYITNLRKEAAKITLAGKSSWSAERSSTWEPIPEEDYGETIFENYSFQRNFQRFGTIGCDSKSLSQTQPHLSSQARLCTTCLAPHSFGQFVSNWTLAADMCHQPDMSHLHGFYLSPAAFKTSHELMPVFSQSKASGYNDILYPSSWNYMDKVMYKPVNATGELGSDTYSAGNPDPPFRQKANTLYWRGATSEGVSAGLHAWRGMTRQRLIHLANNATSDSDHDRTTILLADPSNSEEYKYFNLPGSALLSLGLQQVADIRIAPNIVRCGGVDCPDQELEFGLVTPVDFQQHWKYKFLFDMDGAGFSGRFLPFLQSRSLPFKTALFREWYDSRITAWRHFVPIDLRLHGVWSTLAYFAGVDGVWPTTGKKYNWAPHTIQAETIAEEGRKWAGQVLRKEDMEVYFFRLLLEWGRLTDDRRDKLGFSMT